MIRFSLLAFGILTLFIVSARAEPFDEAVTTAEAALEAGNPIVAHEATVIVEVDADLDSKTAGLLALRFWSGIISATEWDNQSLLRARSPEISGLLLENSSQSTFLNLAIAYSRNEHSESETTSAKETFERIALDESAPKSARFYALFPLFRMARNAERLEDAHALLKRLGDEAGDVPSLQLYHLAMAAVLAHQQEDSQRYSRLRDDALALARRQDLTRHPAWAVLNEIIVNAAVDRRDKEAVDAALEMLESYWSAHPTPEYYFNTRIELAQITTELLPNDESARIAIDAVASMPAEKRGEATALWLQFSIAPDPFLISFIEGVLAKPNQLITEDNPAFLMMQRKLQKLYGNTDRSAERIALLNKLRDAPISKPARAALEAAQGDPKVEKAAGLKDASRKAGWASDAHGVVALEHRRLEILDMIAPPDAESVIDTVSALAHGYAEVGNPITGIDLYRERWSIIAANENRDLNRTIKFLSDHEYFLERVGAIEEAAAVERRSRHERIRGDERAILAVLRGPLNEVEPTLWAGLGMSGSWVNVEITINKLIDIGATGRAVELAQEVARVVRQDIMQSRGEFLGKEGIAAAATALALSGKSSESRVLLVDYILARDPKDSGDWSDIKSMVTTTSRVPYEPEFNKFLTALAELMRVRKFDRDDRLACSELVEIDPAQERRLCDQEETTNSTENDSSDTPVVLAISPPEILSAWLDRLQAEPELVREEALAQYDLWAESDQYDLVVAAVWARAVTVRSYVTQSPPNLEKAASLLQELVASEPAFTLYWSTMDIISLLDDVAAALGPNSPLSDDHKAFFSFVLELPQWPKEVTPAEVFRAVRETAEAQPVAARLAANTLLKAADAIPDQFEVAPDLRAEGVMLALIALEDSGKASETAPIAATLLPELQPFLTPVIVRAGIVDEMVQTAAERPALWSDLEDQEKVLHARLDAQSLPSAVEDELLIFDLGKLIEDHISGRHFDKVQSIIKLHASLHELTEFDGTTFTTRIMRQTPEPRLLAAWSLQLASSCETVSGFGVPRGLSGLSACVNTAHDLALESLKRLRGAPPPPNFFNTGFTPERPRYVFDAPITFAAELSMELDGLATPEQVTTLEQATVEALLRAPQDAPTFGLQALSYSGLLQENMRERAREREVLARLSRAGQDVHQQVEAFYNEQTLPSISDIDDVLAQDEAILIIDSEAALVWRKGHRSIHSLNIEEDVLREMLNRLHNSLDPAATGLLNRPPDFDAQAAYEIWKIMFEPLQTQLGASKHLSIIASGLIAQTPFEALVTTAPKAEIWQAHLDEWRPDWMVERWTIRLAPSLGTVYTLHDLESSAAPYSFLGLGAPMISADGPRPATVDAAILEDGSLDLTALATLGPLQHAEEEIEALTIALDGDPEVNLLGSEFTSSGLSEIDWSAYRVIAFATHGLASATEDVPIEQLLVLTGENGAPAGAITARELAMLEFDANLIILSACDTGPPPTENSNSVLIGFANALMVAGTRSAVISRWPVLSDRAAQFTLPAAKAAHNKTSVAAALSAAARVASKVGTNEPWTRHPATWAMFAVVGDVVR